ncbi:hypothetical protein VITFI_CDS1494 [Vitreoscilla filiformis]|uniref:Transcription factor zinc-finger domain-containing protein n=1 Tax=Vitreoscilla filiformis TaxID=63 RepID=A0A221KE18_VITFI|nr:zf-TFIIB domain-containing protein [Vitreoscilla filiformis]ASM77272.1 hypothetical protein VITFI_CDS1494 [Vitreoscilla filiformis]
MRCPVCPDQTLVMTERQGVEIDYCPKCRGVWLDRGELDKIIAASAQHETAPRTNALPAAPQTQPMPPAPPAYQGYQNFQPPPAYPPQQPPAQPYHGRRDFADSDYHEHRHGNYKRKSWLSDLFD